MNEVVHDPSETRSRRVGCLHRHQTRISRGSVIPLTQSTDSVPRTGTVPPTNGRTSALVDSGHLGSVVLGGPAPKGRIMVMHNAAGEVTAATVPAKRQSYQRVDTIACTIRRTLVISIPIILEQDHV
jgi:hypothetical protein